MPLISPCPDERGLPFGPSTRYQGSKRKLQPWLMSQFENLTFSSIADVMAGTASVAYAMKRLGKRVITNDHLRFNYETSVAFIENYGVHLTSEDTTWLLTTHQSVQYTSFIGRSFRGMYFTAEENAWLDRTAANIVALASLNQHGRAGAYKTAIARHALVQACLAKRPFNLFHRRNLYLREADVPRKFGNKTTWETPFSELFSRFVDEANRCVFDNGQNNESLNADVATLEDIDAELVYIDPPYFAQDRERIRSNYRHLYHFVEGLVQYEIWPSLVDAAHHLKPLQKTGHSTDNLFDCKKEEIDATYTSWIKGLIEQWPNSQLAISYKRPGVPSIEALKQLLAETGRTVKTVESPYKYALSKKNGQPGENIEVLLLGY